MTLGLTAPLAHGVEMTDKTTLKPKCGKCGSGQVYYRMTDNAFQCRLCGHRTPKQEKPGKKK